MPDTHRTVAALLCAASGLSVIFAMGVRPRIVDLDLILSAGAGALIGGALCARLFGHPGRLGVILATLAAVLSTLIGAAIAGAAYGMWEGPTLAGIVYGPMTVGHAILNSLPVLLTWTLTMTVAHLAVRALSVRFILPS
jgi:hypothetical protein